MPSTSFRDLVVKNIQESLALKQAMLDQPLLLDALLHVGERLSASFKSGGKALLFGNGGSAADAQHLAAEFIGRFERERHALPAIALTTNSSNVTALANDYGYEAVFARQLEGLGKPGDVAIGLTTSGKSPNVLCALRAARKLDITTVVMTGNVTDHVAGLADFCIAVPSKRTARVQEAHVLLGHILCEIVENGLAD
jgi:D-sedoheptulose 7-phosphate isomerase